MKQIQYNGNNIFKGINFGLYDEDDIEFKETKELLLDGFKEKFEAEIKTRLKQVGLKLIGFKYFSPKEYNFSNDSIDPIISIVEKNMLKKTIIAKKDLINKELAKNKSCDGYMALTVNNVDEELDKLDSDGYEVDSIVLRELLDLDCSEFDKQDYFRWEDNEDGNN